MKVKSKREAELLKTANELVRSIVESDPVMRMPLNFAMQDLNTDHEVDGVVHLLRALDFAVKKYCRLEKLINEINEMRR